MAEAAPVFDPIRVLLVPGIAIHNYQQRLYVKISLDQ
jgi:hypothetical protein